MLPDVEYRQLVPNLRLPGHPGARRRSRFRESLDTLILGTLSTSIGVVLMAAFACGVARHPIPGWNERAISSSASYYIPSKDCAIAALIGEALGLAGIILARYRHDTISPTSAAGTAICFLHISLFFLHVSLMELL
jgi:hypothetical protein